MYKYTWDHLLLFAQMCNCEDTNATVTENWVKALENQQERLFPFTLWPLTYRTSAVIASTSLISPSIVTKTEDKCSVVLKIYRSNEVVIMCFQHSGDQKSTSCNEMCQFNTDGISQGHGVHSSNKKKPLVPCGLINMYSKIKKKAMIELVKFRVGEMSNFSCIICTGYDKGAILASFMACDLANEFKAEAEFMGLEEPTITVDCVCFSTPTVGNDVYWEEFENLIDKHVSVKHVEESGKENKRTGSSAKKINKAFVFVGNNTVPITNNNHSIRMNFRFNSTNNKVKSVPCSRYIEDIDKKLNVL